VRKKNIRQQSKLSADYEEFKEENKLCPFPLKMLGFVLHNRQHDDFLCRSEHSERCDVFGYCENPVSARLFQKEDEARHYLEVINNPTLTVAILVDAGDQVIVFGGRKDNIENR
jgi:hypothetical protein